MKSKKIQAIIVASLLSVNLLLPGGPAFADELKSTNTKLSNYNDLSKQESQKNLNADSNSNVDINNLSVDKLKNEINSAVDKTPISDFDKLSKDKTLTKNVYVKEIISRVGENNIKSFASKSKENADFLNWLLNDETAMKEYLDGGLPSKIKQGTMDAYFYGNDNKVVPAKELSALEVWSKIWNKDSASREGINLKIAVATSLEFASPVMSWPANKVIDPVERYLNFKDANQNNELFPCFRTFNVKNLRNIVNVKLTNEDIVWLRQHTKDVSEGKIDEKFKWQKEHIKKKDLLSQDKIAESDYTIQYTTKNPEGKSVFGSGFYGDNPTIQKVVEYGGVCGALSKYGTASSQVFGVPAYAVGQPGHCAFLYLKSDNHWYIGNNISGWKGTAHYTTTIPYMFLHETLSQNQEAFDKSEELRMLANDVNSNEKAKVISDEATKACPLNYSAWESKLDLMLKDPSTSAEEFEKVNSDIMNTFAQYPQVMANLLVKIKDKVINNRAELQKYVSEYKDALNKVTDNRQKPYVENILNDMQKNGLYLATFSFDGKNAGKLNGTKAGVDEYSLDGGKTYKLVKEDSQQLTKEELDSITSENGILIRVKGTDNANLISIKKAANINVINNDEENLIFGLDKNMEFSSDNGVAWTRYNGNNLPDLSKDMTLLVRRAAAGNTVASNITKLVFTNNELPKGFILHKDMTVDSYSSQQDNGSAATKAIDGNVKTIWHTKWDGSDKHPFITLKLNKEYDISKLTYLPRQAGNYNGNITKYKISTSLDGKNFTEVASGSWANNRAMKTAEFKASKAQYVKLEVIQGVNGYASATDISLYTN